ncbi:hypothetical protein QQG55_4520 [Brugia pahangi]
MHRTEINVNVRLGVSSFLSLHMSNISLHMFGVRPDDELQSPSHAILIEPKHCYDSNDQATAPETTLATYWVYIMDATST